MTKRTPRQQTKHNKEVQRLADYYRGQGFRVEADIKGEDQPDAINHRRPDVVAKKGGKEIIVEVETRETDAKDQSQHDAFKDYADRSKYRRFRKKVV